MTDVIRWGRTAYETDAALDAERQAAQALGLSWQLRSRRDDPGPLNGTRVLVVPSKVRVTEQVAERLGAGLVLTTTSGYDHIDVAACQARGIVVARCPLARRDPVVEHALAAGLSLMRQLPALDSAARRGHWARGELDTLAPRGLAGATVAVVGLGVIGRRMCEVLSALGAQVVGVDPLGGPPSVRVLPLDEALRQADLVTLHCSLTASSHRLIDGAALDVIAPHAVVVNTSRGPVLDVLEAVKRVRQGRLRGLAVDVFDEEPWPQLITAADLPSVAFTPHASGYIHDLGQRVAREVAANLGAWQRGEALPGGLGALSEQVGDRL